MSLSCAASPAIRSGVALGSTCLRFGRAPAPVRELDIGRDRLRPPDQEALDLAAPFAHEERALALGLDALGDHRHAERLPQPEDGAHDRRRLGVDRYVGDEALVDLNLV